MKFSPTLTFTTVLALGSIGCAAQSTSDPEATGGTSGSGGDTSAGTGGGNAVVTPGDGDGDTAVPGGTGGASTGSGGGSSSPSSCAAIDPNDLLSDFEGVEAKLSEVGGRSGSWYMSDDGTGTSSPVKIPDTPLSAEAGGACDSGYAFRTSGNGYTGWGALLAVDLVPKISDVKQAYDASAYSGVALRARASGSLQIRIEVATVDTMTEGRVCNPEAVSGDPDRCGDHFGMNVVLSGEWKDITIPFAQMTQKGWGLAASGLDASAVYSVRFKVEGGDYDYTIDDVHLVK